MAGGVVDKDRHREASSDASLWEEIDDIDTSFDGITTPPLPPPPKSNLQLATASHPMTITDSTPESSTLHQGLELELFPSGQPSSSTSRSNQLLPPSSFDFDTAAGATEPWTQPDMKDTQYLRDQWLISVGQKQPSDLVEDFMPHESVKQLSKQSTGATENGSRMASDLTKAWSDRAQLDTAKSSTAKCGRSSLLDQLDVICSSPSQHLSSSPNANEHPTTPKSPATERQPLQPVGNIVSNAQEPFTVDDDGGENQELSATDMLEMSCSPPSQTFPHMTLIKDMPQELQNLYHRLAFGKSSSTSSTPTHPGTTVRGTRGKTWQTTWQDEENDPAETSSRSNGARTTTATSSTSSTRGRKAASTTTARKTTRGGKTRSSFASSSSSSSSRARSDYFASWRVRGRGRGRGRARGR